MIQKAKSKFSQMVLRLRGGKKKNLNLEGMKRRLINREKRKEKKGRRKHTVPWL